MKKNKETFVSINRITLGLVMLIPGLLALFSTGPTNVASFLSSIGFPISIFFAWILIASEILCGMAILANYKLEYTALPPTLIMILAALLVSLPISEWPSFLMHIVIATNYLLLAAMNK